MYTQGALFTAYLCIAVGHQSNRHDVIQQEPGWEEHLNEKLSAAGTQTLIVEPHLHWIGCLTGPGEVRLKALLQNLHKGAEVGEVHFCVITLCVSLCVRVSAGSGHFSYFLKFNREFGGITLLYQFNLL